MLTLPHGPHIHVKPWCDQEECLGHSWDYAVDLHHNYGYKIFHPNGWMLPTNSPIHWIYQVKPNRTV